jgi:hypothetical protein
MTHSSATRKSALPAHQILCQGCKKTGLYDPQSGDEPAPWCTCSARAYGPYVAAPGVVIAFRFDAPTDAAFREECRLAGNAEREARDALSGRFVKAGKGWRELPKASPKRRALESAYRKACRVCEALQARCTHPERSPYSKAHCGLCHAYVECDVALHHHFVRECGVRQANRLAV